MLRKKDNSGTSTANFGKRIKSRAPRGNLGRNLVGICVLVALMLLYMYGIVSLTKVPSKAADSTIPQPDQVPVAVTKPPKTSVTPEEEEVARLEMQVKLTTTGADGISLGYVRVPKLAPGQDDGNDKKLHIIFSSGCNWFQHWQSELLLATAFHAGQRGRVTRIVSGCHDKSAENVKHASQTFPEGVNDLLVPLEHLNRSVNENFGLYITPSFEGARDFPWLNKASSIEYFNIHARPELDRLGETVVAVLDPDFVFLKKLSVIQLDPDWILNTIGQFGGSSVVEVGRPLAQQYGLGGQWRHKFPVATIAGAESPALNYDDESAAKFFSVGPPLILHKDDWVKLAPLWRQNMKPVLQVENDILADMWAYCIAAAHLQLEHQILDQYMISCTSQHEPGEAFPWLNQFTDFSCHNPTIPDEKKTPNFIHMASNFKAPESQFWMFHKGHVPGKILDCDTPLIIQPPDDLWHQSKSVEAKQGAWILCHIIAKLNRVATEYKEKFCVGKKIENRQLVRLLQDKTVDHGCDHKKDKWCFPLAQIGNLPTNWRAQLAEGIEPQFDTSEGGGLNSSN